MEALLGGAGVMLDELGSVEEIVAKDVVVAVEVDVGMDVAVGVKGTRDVSSFLGIQVV